MFGKHRKGHSAVYDRTGKVPVVRCSICTGEQVAGFKQETSGKFEEVMLLRSDTDFQDFLRLYGLEASEVRKEW